VQHKLPSGPTLSQKRAVFPAFSPREVTSGQMRTIGIHFVIYRSNWIFYHLPLFHVNKYIALNYEWNITGNYAVRMHKTLNH